MLRPCRSIRTISSTRTRHCLRVATGVERSAHSAVDWRCSSLEPRVPFKSRFSFNDERQSPPGNCAPSNTEFATDACR